MHLRNECAEDFIQVFMAAREKCRMCAYACPIPKPYKWFWWVFNAVGDYDQEEFYEALLVKVVGDIL